MGDTKAGGATRDTGSKLERAAALGADIWLDSFELADIREADFSGAAGATADPAAVHAALESGKERWLPILDSIIAEDPLADEEDIARRLVEAAAKEAAEALLPAFERSGGRRGLLALHAAPKLYRDARALADRSLALSKVAPNIVLRLPATVPGLAAMEAVMARGVSVQADLCFSVTQAVAAAEACERGIAQARSSGLAADTLQAQIMIMAGRLDDYIRKAAAEGDVTIDPACYEWAGIAVFKQTRALFTSWESPCRLMASGFRSALHWTELIGDNLALAVPYKWWRRIEDSMLATRAKAGDTVNSDIAGELTDNFPDFRRAYDPLGMRPAEFQSFGPTCQAIREFLDGHQKIVSLVRERLLAA